jgi:hypothetical protein
MLAIGGRFSFRAVSRIENASQGLSGLCLKKTASLTPTVRKSGWRMSYCRQLLRTMRKSGKVWRVCSLVKQSLGLDGKFTSLVQKCLLFIILMAKKQVNEGTRLGT